VKISATFAFRGGMSRSAAMALTQRGAIALSALLFVFFRLPQHCG
jgi:hypothetical protein